MDDNVSLDVEVGHVHYALHERAELCSHSYNLIYPDNVTEEHYLPGHPPSTRFRNYFCNATLSQEQIWNYMILNMDISNMIFVL